MRFWRRTCFSTSPRLWVSCLRIPCVDVNYLSRRRCPILTDSVYGMLLISYILLMRTPCFCAMLRADSPALTVWYVVRPLVFFHDRYTSSWSASGWSAVRSLKCSISLRLMPNSPAMDAYVSPATARTYRTPLLR